LTNILTSLAWILFFYSVQTSGVIYTVLIFLLQPLLVYLAAVLLLKERPTLKKTIAFAVVLAAIAVADLA
jgi:EamA domain-containing membrane protein RarD